MVTLKVEGVTMIKTATFGSTEELREQRSKLKSILQPSRLAVPTVLLALLCPATVVFSLLLLVSGTGSEFWFTKPFLFLINTIACYASFTPMHDAVHGSVSRNKFLNHMFGRMAGWCLFAPYGMFRWCHLTHHSFTNISHKDPDHYSGAGAKWQLPLRWASQDLYYYFFTVKQSISFLKKKSRSADETSFLNKMLLSLGGNILNVALVVSVALYFGIFLDGLLLWVLPVRIAVFCLSFGFDFLPHIPHNIPVSEDKYRTTSVWDTFLLSIPFFNQNYHAMHHLYPAAPFYKYHKLYFALQKEVKAKGTPVFEGLARTRVISEH
jgi:beta-carotene hydroxylase